MYRGLYGGLSGACASVLLYLAAAQPALASPSVYTAMPDDARAVRVKGAGDGRADDSAAIQQAIDAAAAKGGGGIVFLPAGTYRISRTLFLWPGVRIFGIGEKRPVIELGANTPGFQRGVAHMLIFAGGKRQTDKDSPPAAFPPAGSVPFDKNVADANPGTFYSALGNIDFRIKDGNPAATAIRFHSAQHSFVSHVDFDIGSGLAGLYHVANEAEDLHFKGGRYGILAEKTSPAWPFALVDATFEGQRDAAIREHEAGLTLLNVAFRNVPVGIEIDRGYGDWLWGQDVRFENVSKAGVIISNEKNVYTQVGFQNVLATNTPTFARFRESGRTVAGKGTAYKVSSFTHGLTLPGLGRIGEYKTDMQAESIASLPAPAAPAIRPLPPVSDWVNVRTLGAKGDNSTDDTAILQKAIDSHRVVYLPAGFYKVSDTLRLRADTVLIGLHPSLTQIVLPDGTPAFQGVGAPKALVESAQGGDAIVAGIALDTNGANPRATALLWKAGASSMVNDVKFQGGHGTDAFDGSRRNPYNNNATADPDAARRWAGQYASLWVTQGGGGTFANIWSPSSFGHPGILISDTETPGRLIQASVEHHVRTEIGLNRVANWELLAPQTEGEAGESGDAVALEIRDSRNILVANFHGYRVTRTRKPAPTAVSLYNSHDIRFRNVHVNAESGVGTCDENGCATFLRLTKYPFENAIRQRPGRQAGRWLLRHRRRRSRCAGPTLFHRSLLLAHLALVRHGPSGNGPRRRARSREPQHRQVGQPARPLLLWPQRHGLQRHARCAGNADQRHPRHPGGQGQCGHGLSGQLVGEWRVQGSDRSQNLSVHHPCGDVRPRHGPAQCAILCLARRQHRAPGLARLRAGTGGSSRPALLPFARQLWLRTGQAWRAHLCHQRIGKPHLQRTGQCEWHAERP
jgi:hypothetical protein